jgi:alpha-beta hydrolase superfamily lysophospholipase
MRTSNRRCLAFALSIISFAGVVTRSGATGSSPSPPLETTTAAGLTAKAPDAFYNPPAHLPSRPGALLRSEPLRSVILPHGMQGWRILYTTTVDNKTPATAVATVFAPVHLPPGPRPVITWEHGTTGVLQKCMPSLLSAPTAGIPARDQIVDAGWIVVATDYQFTKRNGPFPYFIGPGEARAALDSVRAARQMRGLTLGSRTVVWGHSQGGHAALWTGIVGPSYAPDVKIAGVVAISPAADFKNDAAINLIVDKGFGPYLALAYSSYYPDVTFRQALRPEALHAASEMVNLCVQLEPNRMLSLAESFEGRALTTSTSAPLAKRLEQNAANGAIGAPLAIAQGLADKIVVPRATDEYVAERCAAHQRLEYWTFAGITHESIVAPGAPLEKPLIAWTKARFANEPQPSGCSRKSFS